MKQRKTICCLLCAVVSCYARAGVDFVPHPGYSTPLYFSGTNARAFYRASVTSPHNHIKTIKLELNDIETLSKTTPAMQTGGEEGGGMMALIPVQDIAIMFDSRAYKLANNGNIVVKCKVYAETVVAGGSVGGQWYDHTYTVPVKNRAALFALDSLENKPECAGGAAALQRLSNFPATLTANQGWTYSTFSNKIAEDCNVVFYAGHSTLTAIFDGQHLTPEPSSWLGAPIYAWATGTGSGTPSVEAMRFSQIGDVVWFPPYNMTARPAINFAVHMSCSTVTSGGASKFATYLYPYWNEYDQLVEDQVYLGWKVPVMTEDYQQLSDLLFLDLIDGDTAEVAARDTIESATNTAGSYVPADFKAVGDKDARLICVYNPGNTAKVPYRGIDMP